MAYRAVGPETRDEINPVRFRHDMRRKGERFKAFVAQAEVAVSFFVFLLLIALVIPGIADLALVVGAVLYFLVNKAQLGFTLPIKLPRHSARVDDHERHPGHGRAMPAMGTFYLGNDRQTGAEIWLSNRDAGVHFLCLGTTGSGKTELLLGLCQNALNLGSGFMFVDGKAQDKIAFKIMDLVRARGRDDDFLALNFMTGAKDIIGPQPSKITNTMNPFSYGSASMISQIVVGLMSSGAGGDDMWKDRAISFVEAISPPLTYLRDYYGVMLDVNKYRQYFELERLEELAWKGADMYPGLGQVLEGLQNYLLNLPAYDKNKYGKKNQAEDTKLQHGFITMQLVRAFTSLADTYGHIVRVPLGEVFFPDLVKERRILVVMLPSLEKTPSETANIGKIIVTALRNIMAESLGAKLEGDRKSLENEAGRKLLPPYVVILDEYGYYAVKGFAVAFAQARSLGFVCVVGGQDLASFQKESKEEAVSICGNALKLDEPVLTPNGFRRMGSIKAGDYVMHQNGYPTRVLGVFPQGHLALYEIKFADGRIMEVSGDHLWEVSEPASPAKVLSTCDAMKVLAQGRRLFVPLYGPDQGFDSVIAARDKLRRLLDEVFARVGANSDIVIHGDLSKAAEITALARALGGWAISAQSESGERTLRIGGYPLMSALAITADYDGANDRGLEILSVAPLGTTAECQCIKVESPDGLFVAGDYLVTHNTRIKLFGSIEDPGETMKFAVDTGGKAMVAKAGQYEFDTGMFSPSFSDQGNVNFDVIDRIDPSDIKVQKEGEFTVVWGPYVIRTKCYFVDPVQVSKVRLNHFVGVHPPSKQQLNEIDVAVSGLLRRISAGNLSESVQSDNIGEIAAAAIGLSQAKATALGVLNQGICAVLAVEMERDIERRRFTAAVETKGQSTRTPDRYRQISDLHKAVPDPMAIDYSAFPGSFLPDPSGTDGEGAGYDDQVRHGGQGHGAGLTHPSDLDMQLTPEDALPMARDAEQGRDQMGVFVPRRKQGFGADVFSDTPDSERGFAEAVYAGDSLPMLDYQRTYRGLQEIKRGLGSSEEEAGAAARATVKSMEDATRYPQSVPKEKSGDEVEDLLKGAISALEESET